MTSTEREVLRDIIILDEDIERRIRLTVANQQEIPFTLDELDELADHAAAEANHAQDSDRQRQLNGICGRIESLLDTFEEE